MNLQGKKWRNQVKKRRKRDEKSEQEMVDFSVKRRYNLEKNKIVYKIIKYMQRSWKEKTFVCIGEGEWYDSRTGRKNAAGRT